MRPISIEGFVRPAKSKVGSAPMLQWIAICDLVVDPSYQRPIVGKGRKNVELIARDFSWSCFAPVVVSPVEGGKLAIIDGQHRTTAAALIGIERVPCQIVIAPREEQATAFKAINGMTTPISRMALHAAALVAGEPAAVALAKVCEEAEVELLRYPVQAKKLLPGQTMAVATISQCLERYGEDTVIAALQCITMTENNRNGALSALPIKSISTLLHANPGWREPRLALLEAFDAIDLSGIEAASIRASMEQQVSRTTAMVERLHAELSRKLKKKRNAPTAIDIEVSHVQVA